LLHSTTLKYLATLLFAVAPALWAQALPALSADAAAEAVARGARVIDVRPHEAYLASHLPGAVPMDPAAAFSITALQRAVSSKGVDLSREVIVVGLPGDPLAQRVQAQLALYATGRVSWLVGGVVEWAMTGRPLEAGAVALPAVPQYLVPLDVQVQAPRMAGSGRRDVPLQSRQAVAVSLGS